MTIYRPQSAFEAVKLRKANLNSVYLAGATDCLRLGGAVDKDTVFIDINGLVEKGITDCGDGIIRVGALTTFTDMIESPLVPSVIKEACRFSSSFEKRNAQTVGGNIGLRRSDSYLMAIFAVMGVTFHSITPHGEEDKSVVEYANTQCRRLITYFLIDTKKIAHVRRFGLTSTSHATLIAAEYNGLYALSVSGSPFVCGTSADIWKEVDYKDDITGSKEYKEYLAKTVFTLGRNL